MYYTIRFSWLMGPCLRGSVIALQEWLEQRDKSA